MRDRYAQCDLACTTDCGACKGRVFDRMADDPRWEGFGYLGMRRVALDDSDPESPAQPELVEAADARVLGFARAEGWTDQELFDWANSKLGRWFGDAIFGSLERFDVAWDRAVAWGLLRKVDAE